MPEPRPERVGVRADQGFARQRKKLISAGAHSRRREPHYAVVLGFRHAPFGDKQIYVPEDL